jgi:DNA replication and repair protein RecF
MVGETAFDIQGHLLSDSGNEQTVLVRFDRTTGQKEISLNRIPLEKRNLLVGRFPVVLLSPEGVRITSGPPAERRKFLDLVLSQASRSHFEDLLEYRRVLRQRNCLLAEQRTGSHPVPEVLDPWTTRIAQVGARITHRRRDFVKTFRQLLEQTYRELAAGREEAGLRYHTRPEVSNDASVQSIEQSILGDLARTRNEEMARGTTMVGPHRDDLAMTINGLDIQCYGSQGQHKTFLLSMKIAECRYLCDLLGETPVLLLDDLFGELDLDRSGRTIGLLSGLGQSFITATSDSVFGTTLSWNGYNKRFLVHHGTCREE